MRLTSLAISLRPTPNKTIELNLNQVRATAVCQPIVKWNAATSEQLLPVISVWSVVITKLQPKIQLGDLIVVKISTRQSERAGRDPVDPDNIKRCLANDEGNLLGETIWIVAKLGRRVEIMCWLQPSWRNSSCLHIFCCVLLALVLLCLDWFEKLTPKFHKSLLIENSAGALAIYPLQ